MSTVLLPTLVRSLAGLTLAGAVAVGCGVPAAAPTAADPVVATDRASAPADGGHADGKPCHEVPDESPFERTEASYSMPELTLTTQAGEPFAVQDLAAGDEPVVVNFIFATCTTICPVMTATFSKMRAELGADAERVRMVSITIDPEHDTPEVLAEYAQRFEAPADWLFLTGSSEDVTQVLRSFDTFNGSKFNHEPITVLRAAGQTEWIRLNGLGSGSALAQEVRSILPPPAMH